MSPPHVFLNTGEVIFSRRPCVVKTILGSCVGVCVFDQRLHYGGVSHFLLAAAPKETRSAKYGNVAIPFLINRFLKNGSSLKDLVATISGGSLLLDANEIFFVGERNIQMAEEVLQYYGINITSRRVGGDRGRTIVFRTDTGFFHAKSLGSSLT